MNRTKEKTTLVSTGIPLLDLNFSAPILRESSSILILKMFLDVYFEDKNLALKWLFYARDIRAGLGERRVFRVIFRHIYYNRPIEEFQHLLVYIPDFGRWDDLIYLIDENSPFSSIINKPIINIIKRQIAADVSTLARGERISLLAKWLPSINSKNVETRKLATFIARSIGMNDRTYRKTISKFRKHISEGNVERLMSERKWDKIKYEHVPSEAQVRYRKAFLKHDYSRRVEYVESIKQLRNDLRESGYKLIPNSGYGTNVGADDIETLKKILISHRYENIKSLDNIKGCDALRDSLFNRENIRHRNEPTFTYGRYINKLSQAQY